MTKSKAAQLAEVFFVTRDSNNFLSKAVEEAEKMAFKAHYSLDPSSSCSPCVLIEDLKQLLEAEADKG